MYASRNIDITWRRGERMTSAQRLSFKLILKIWYPGNDEIRKSTSPEELARNHSSLRLTSIIHCKASCWCPGMNFPDLGWQKADLPYRANCGRQMTPLPIFSGRRRYGPAGPSRLEAYPETGPTYQLGLSPCLRIGGHGEEGAPYSSLFLWGTQCCGCCFVSGRQMWWMSSRVQVQSGIGNYGVPIGNLLELADCRISL